MEAIILITAGAGYTIIDGKRYDWKKDDVITIPPQSVHQHFNSSKTEPARFFAVTSLPLMVNTGMFLANQMEGPGKI